MDIPECQPFKETYDKCFQENIANNLSKWVFDPVATQKCEEPFQVKCAYTPFLKHLRGQFQGTF
jgi:hypothetical protein